MINHWEEFNVTPDAREPMGMRVSLTTSGFICMNMRALKNLGEPTHAVLNFDRANSLIGIKPGNAALANAYPLHSWGESPSRIIRAKKFCTYHGIKIERTIIFNEPRINADGFLVLDLKHTHIKLKWAEVEEQERLELEARRRLIEKQGYWYGKRMFPRPR